MNRRKFLTALAGALVLPVVPLDGAGWPTRSRPSDTGYKFTGISRVIPPGAHPNDYTYLGGNGGGATWYGRARWLSSQEVLEMYPCEEDSRCECESRLAMGEQVVTCQAIKEKRTEPWEDCLTWKLHA